MHCCADACCPSGPVHSLSVVTTPASHPHAHKHPLSTTAVYFAVIRTMEGQPDLIMATLQSKFVPTLAANYAIWPLAHLINFRFVPSE